MFKRVAAWCVDWNELGEVIDSPIFREYRIVTVINHLPGQVGGYSVIFEKEVSE